MKNNISKFLGTLLCLVSVLSRGLVYGGGPWSIDDDLQLLQNVHGIMSRKNWEDISKLFNGRHSVNECFDRYNEYLASGLYKKWEKSDIDDLHRIYLGCSMKYRWERLEKRFNLPMAIIIHKYYETCEVCEQLIQDNIRNNTFMPERLWVEDVPDSD